MSDRAGLSPGPAGAGAIDESAPSTYTVVAFHAHPDDEALLTGGTLAKAAAAGHRVVLVVATAGEAGLVGSQFLGDTSGLGAHRMVELRRSAASLGCARVELLGYADSGMDGNASATTRFADADVDEAAARLAAVLNEEQAQVLITYDEGGGYGHPDHVQVHRVGQRAAELAGTPVVLEATIDRDLLAPVARGLSRLGRILPFLALDGLERLGTAYTPREGLTHRIDVRAQAVQKRAAMAAHASQATGGRRPRTLTVFLRLPLPVFRLVLGREWFTERGRSTGVPLQSDLFATLRARSTR